jgi:hypothetical protein
MIDRKRGRITGINIVDLLVILIVLFAILSYISKPDESVYKGNQMYSAIQDFQRLDSRGFLVGANVTGTYLWDKTPFQESGILLPSTLGRLRLRKLNGDIVVIGGERAYLEDVAASLIEMRQIDNYVVVFDLDSKSFESYSELLAYLESVKKEKGADHLYLDVEIAVDAPMTPAQRQRIVNELSSMYLVRSTYFSRTEAEGFVMNMGKGELSELARLKIPDGMVRTNRIRAYAGYENEPDREFPGDYHIVEAQDLL